MSAPNKEIIRTAKSGDELRVKILLAAPPADHIRTGGARGTAAGFSGHLRRPTVHFEFDPAAARFALAPGYLLCAPPARSIH